MVQIICDICGKPIMKDESHTKYRIQKRFWISPFKAEWKEMQVHSKCVGRLITLIREENENAEN